MFLRNSRGLHLQYSSLNNRPTYFWRGWPTVWFYFTDISTTEDTLESLKHSEQSLSTKLSELESTERRVNEELEELELVSWHDKLVMETTRCAQLEADAEDLMSSVAQSEVEVDRWQQRTDEVTAATETLKTDIQQKDADKTRLKEQVAILANQSMYYPYGAYLQGF